MLLDPGRSAVWKRVAGSIGAAGAFGVDLFFALSAYLITDLLFREFDARGSVDVPAFYMRRILRIWPLYFVFLAAICAVALVLPTEQMTARYAIGFALFCGNWLYMAHPIRTMAAPLWSVSIEEQFYLIWPWVVRSGSRALVISSAVALTVIAVVVTIGLSMRGIAEPWLSRNSFVRADGIAAGALLAALLRGRTPRLAPKVRLAMTCACGAVLVTIAGGFDLFRAGLHTIEQVIGYPLVAVASTGLLAATLGSDGRMGKVLRHPGTVWLGRVSYGLYVFHQVGILVADRLFPTHLKHVDVWCAHFFLGLAITAALAFTSYFCLERPFLRLKQRRFTVLRSRSEAVTITTVVAGHAAV